MKTFAPVLALAGLAAATENNIFKRDVSTATSRNLEGV